MAASQDHPVEREEKNGREVISSAMEGDSQPHQSFEEANFC